jgi:putative pyruvate formate lyase activating enzyme
MQTEENNHKNFIPAYLKLHENGELKARGEQLWEILNRCELCPRMCKVNRLKGELGVCKAGSQLKITSFHPHFGEEAPLSGIHGSGTVFLTYCNLKCVFCINWDISHKGEGEECSYAQFAQIMLYLQNKGCHNINFVTPTHYLPHIILAVDLAAQNGLKLPLVYNTCGWERVEMLQWLDGIIDIYLPDFKYFSPQYAAKYSHGADTYAKITKNALLEMNRQVGPAIPGKNGLMNRGLMIRHLIMPENISETDRVIDWIATNLPKNTYLNMMAQYRPVYKAFDYPEIARTITREEYNEVIVRARTAGLTNLDIQDYPF